MPNDYFAYDAALEVINYDVDSIDTSEGKLSLLHEAAHATLGHFHYGSDFELVMMEIDAWHKTRELAKKYRVKIDEEFINQCITTYDNWLSARSTCPKCQTFCLEASPQAFSCFACGADWKVNKRKDCRVRRELI